MAAPPTAPPDPWANVTKAAAAAATLIGVLGSLGAAGVIERMAVNHGRLAFLSLLFVVLAAIGWALAAALPNKGRMELTAQLLGTFLFAVGLLIGVWGVLQTSRDVRQPAVSASLKSGSTQLEARVQANGIPHDDRLAVVVDGLVDRGGFYKPIRRLYTSTLGPTPQGTVEQVIELGVPAGSFEAIGVRAWTNQTHTPCLPEGSGPRIGIAKYPPANRQPGCVVIRLPPLAEEPSLAGTWEESGRSVTVRVRSANAAAPIAVKVVGVRKHSTRALAAAVLRPGADGTVDETVRVPVTAAIRRICATAETLGRTRQRPPRGPSAPLPRPQCPVAKAGPGVAVLDLAVPRAH